MPEEIIFDKYDLKIAKTIIDSRTSDGAKINLAFYNGDHWMDGAGWTGPAPASGVAGGTATMDEIKRAFVSRNAIGEITDRHTGGVLARELHWKLNIESTNPDTGEAVAQEESTDEEQLLVTEAEQILTAWWDSQKAPSKLQDMVRLALLTKRSVLRLYVPPGMLQDGKVPSGGMLDAVKYIWFQHVGTDEDTLNLYQPSATVYRDKSSKQDIGLFSYKKAPDLPGGEEGEELAELCYVNTDGETVLRIIDAKGNLAGQEPVLFPLGGRLTMYEMTRRLLVGEQIVSQQKLLNLAQTMMQRNVVLGGFLERVWLNAQIPGTTSKDASGKDVFVPNPVYTGAASMNVLQGIVYKDKDGNEQITNPSVVYRDPVPVTTFSETSNNAYLAILEEAQQLHYALAGDATVSAVSRIQARDAFEKDLQITAAEVEAAARWLLETVLAMAAHFAGQSERYAGLRAVVQARIDSGPVSAEEKRAAIELKDAGLWALETSMSATGIEDTDAEKERIAKEGIEQQALGLSDVDRAKIYREYKSAGVPPGIAAKWSGRSDEQVAELEAAIDEQANKEDANATVAAAERLRNLPPVNGLPVGAQPTR